MRGEVRDISSGRGGDPGQGDMPRRLAAIVAGDISGYSRLMQLDEEGTHGRVRRIQRDLIEPTIREHHGRLVKTTGDGFIAIFDSPVEAVRCGIVIQQNLVGRNAALARDRWIAYRIGINLGDVIIETDDVYGDGVNIAARLEGIADPGEVYISGAIYEQIKHKIVCGYESLGDKKVKNITDPIRVYRVLSDPSAFSKTRMRRTNVAIFALGIAVLAVAAAILGYLLIETRRTAREPALATPAQTSPPQQTAAAPPTSQPAETPSPPAAAAVPATTPAAAPSAPAVAPEMVSIPGGSFAMGSNDDASEKPVHTVTVKPFSIGKYPVTVREWNACAAAKACAFSADEADDAPVTNVSWSDAQQFVAWLAEASHKAYRLPSEAEWEFAARGGTQTKYWWGDQLQPGMVNCKNCTNLAAAKPAKVGAYKPNPFGLYDMGGAVDQWVEDCWHKNYQGAPADGSAWREDGCTAHVIRSGSWRNDARYVRPANRDSYDTNVRYPTHGFRVALSP